MHHDAVCIALGGTQEEGEEEVPERYEGDMFGSDDEYKGRGS